MDRTARKPPPSETNVTTALIPAIPVTDGELLMRYARHGDEGAFAELVEKHGRLVWTVCWQVLREHHAIEDAFQATFFILAKRARTIRSCDSLCGWLYRVAYRTALRSRMTAKRKAMLELMADELATLDEKLKNIEAHEQRAILMEELHTLPEQYQMPLVLCYLEGKSRREAAEELGATLEAVKGRLTRGRQLLRHRLIRRGVSLSLAMAAMTVPIKSAAAAVSPQLVGLTVAGCGKWLAGAAKASSTTSVTTSTQVLLLAHQGTVAMTIASFAKPAVVAVALLGAMSATLAVDSADQAPAAAGSQNIDLLAAVDAPNEATISADEVEVQFAAPAEEKAWKVQPPLPVAWKVRELVEKPRRPAPVRVPQPAQIRGAAGITLTAPEPTFDEEPTFDFEFDHEFDIQNNIELDLQVKVAELETHVVHLQLESKELEIEALDESGEKREKLLEESRKKLLKAEAEQLKIQIEKQQMHLKELEKALKEQVKRAGEQAKHAEEQAKHSAEQAKEAAKAARMAVDAELAAGRTLMIEKQAEAAVIAKAAQAAAIEQADMAKQAAKAQVASARASTSVPRIKKREVSDVSLQPGDNVKIEVVGAFPDRPINDVYTVESMGTVALGATYGRVDIAGQSLMQAEETIVKHLKKMLTDVQVQVTLVEQSSLLSAPVSPSAHGK